MFRLIDDLGDHVRTIERLIAEKERSGIKVEASLHRWWSKRFVFLYRGILASFLLDEGEDFERALLDPGSLDAQGRVYFEPLAGGGTGLVEASLYNYKAYGIDVNPLAVKIIEGYSVLRLEVDFGRIISVIEDVKKELSPIWTYKGKEVSYVLITRGRAPTWVMTKRVNNVTKRVVLCPHCGTAFETESSGEARCPHCGNLVEVTVKPVHEPKRFVNYSGWKAYGMILSDARGSKEFTFDEEWLKEREEKLEEVELEMDVEIGEIREGARLLRAGIDRPRRLFTKAQLVTFRRLAERARTLSHQERLLLMLAASDSVKTCSVLSRWYPPLNEPVLFAGGIKGYWVPEHTAETNPLAEHARGTLFSELRNQRRIKRFKLRGEIRASQGDALTEEFPKSDLIVIDPPYYKLSPSYTSLSYPHVAIANLFEKMNLRGALEREIDGDDYFEKLLTILKKSEAVLREDGRIVLMINMKDEWERLYEVIDRTGLQVVNKYQMLGESPGLLGRSNSRSNTLIVLSRRK